ncbi:MAG: transcriptional repressor [Cycloclasticus sp.]|nr:transcriptional repressor [Cycloclasticus sp.]
MNTHAKQPKQLSIDTLLIESDITPTQQRLEIARFLFGKQQHVSADQILNSINQGQHPVSKATVYNTLGLFASKGLLREVIIDPNKVFYDTNTEKHHHFYNTDTCDLTDINSDDITISQLPNLPKGTDIQSVDVIIKVKNQ